MKRYCFSLAAFLLCGIPLVGQDSLLVSQNKLASPSFIANKNARFYRPSIFQKENEKNTFSIGGYTSANTRYFVTDGEGDGLHFQLADFQLFAQTSFLDNRIHFITEIGYNTTSQQFELTEAGLNLRFSDAFNLRGGVVLPPIGYFNQNGDSPTTDFVDWPLVSTNIIPSRLSEVGFGMTGQFGTQNNLGLTYELYAVNGLQEAVVDNDLPRTAIPLGKSGNLLGIDNNSKLAFTGRIGIQQKQIGEIGFSVYTGAYNSTEVNEVVIDESRNLAIYAVDGNFNIYDLKVKSELSYATIDVSPGLTQIFGAHQLGYFVEMSYPIWKNINLLGNRTNFLNLAFRLENVDYNLDNFTQTETKIYDEIIGFRTGLALHLGQRTVLKANYTFFKDWDILGNLSKTAGFQFGLSSYF